MEIHSALVYVLQHQENPLDVQVAHISHLKPHHGGEMLEAVNEWFNLFQSPSTLASELLYLQDTPTSTDLGKQQENNFLL